jgi:hypothetical protein
MHGVEATLSTAAQHRRKSQHNHCKQPLGKHHRKLV